MATWPDGIDPNIFKGNIEMPMGLIKLPVAAVGPLNICGQQANGEFIAPFATIEGALTASCQRGINAINAAGGVQTRTGKQFCSRGPCFVTGSAEEAILLANWVKKHKDIIQDEVVSKVSNHAILDDIMPLYDFEVSSMQLSLVSMILNYNGYLLEQSHCVFVLADSGCAHCVHVQDW